MTIAFTLPLRTYNPANQRLHWRKVATRARKDREAIAYTWRGFGGRQLVEGETAVITLTRVAPRRLDDHDGLRGAFKAVADEIATQLGFDRNDNNQRLTWAYAQRRGKPRECAVEVSITVSEPAKEFDAMVDELTWKEGR